MQKKLKWRGKTFTLTTEPKLWAHTDCYDRYQEWHAYAIDDEGHDCLIIWDEKECFDGKDVAQACDWDEFQVFTTGFSKDD